MCHFTQKDYFKIRRNLRLLVVPEDFMCHFTQKDFFVGLEVQGRFLPDKRLSVEKRHLSFFLSPSSLLISRLLRQQFQKKGGKTK